MTATLKTALLIEKYAQGVNAGTSYSGGAFYLRPLNTVVHNDIPGLTLTGGGDITIPSGISAKLTISAPFINPEVCQLGLMEGALVLDRVTLAEGYNAALNEIGVTGILVTQVTGLKVVYVASRVNNAFPVIGRGKAYNSAVDPPTDEIYTRVFVESLEYLPVVANFAQFEHIEASGVGGGSYTRGIWHKRIFDTENFNGIAGCSLSDSQITLPIGIFRIKAVLNNYPNGSVISAITRVVGGALTVARTNATDSPILHVEGIVTNTEESVFEVSTFNIGDRPDEDGWGRAHGAGGEERYDTIIIEQID